jgi:predicted transposase YbfD/YdcC
MQSTRLPLPLDSLTDAEREALLTDHSLHSLAAVLGRVPDPRSRHGRRYELPFLLTCLVAAMLCGCNSLDAVGAWCQEHRRLLRRLFGARRHLTPTGSLYRRLLPRLSAASLEWALAGWMLTTRPVRDTEPVALDGKVLCGAHTTTTTAPQLFSVVTHQSGETLCQVPIADKGHEIPTAQALLGWLLLTHRVVTADALHTHPPFAHGILDAGADYLLCVKGNQHALHADLVDVFADPATHCTTATTVDRRKGRTERRTVRVSTELVAHIERFPGVAQVLQITREVTSRDGSHTDVDYFITSCTPQDADPDRLLALARGHWSIERQHWLRDVVFGEDASHVRTGAAPQILAALRNAILTLLRRTGATAVAAARRTFAAHPSTAFALVARPFPAYR